MCTWQGVLLSSLCVPARVKVAPSRCFVQVLWHSAAHVLGAALQIVHGDDVLLTDGPPLRDDAGTAGGFFYELHLASGRRLDDGDHAVLVAAAKAIVKEKHK